MVRERRDVSDNQKRKIMRDNAVRLYGWNSSKGASLET